MPERKPEQPKGQPQQLVTPSVRPLPWPVEVGFRIVMGIGGLALIGTVVVSEIKGHAHGVVAYTGHAILVGLGALLMFVAYRGMTRTAAFAKGIATAWRKAKE